MSDNYGLLLAGASPFDHEAPLGQEDGQLAGMPQKADGVVVLVTDDRGEARSAGQMPRRHGTLGVFAAEALEMHRQSLSSAPPITKPGDPPVLDEVALGGFLLFGASRSSR